MIRITVKEAAERRGVTSSYQLLKKIEKAGFKTYPNMASKLWKNQMVTLPTLDRVAEALGCGLDELYAWNPTKKAAPNGKR